MASDFEHVSVLAENDATFMARIKQLKEEGMTASQIAESFGMSVRQLSERYRAARASARAIEAAKAKELKEKGYSYKFIGKALGGKSESTVRSLLDTAQRN